MKVFDSYLEERNVYEFCNEPLFVQSEYYNLYLQKSIEELGDSIDIKNVLVTSAQEVAFSQFSRLFKLKGKLKTEERKSLVEDYYANAGFGKVNLKYIQNKGGHIEALSEHYSMAWLRHFGSRDTSLPGVSYFTLGFLCGITEAIFDVKPGTFDGKQVKCISKGDGVCRFEIFRGFKRKINMSPAMGMTHETFEEKVKPTGSVISSIVGLKLSGLHIENGIIDHFDTSFTKHYVNYFALISIKLLMQANKKLGPSGFKKIKDIITKTSEKNAYFTFGKILNSDYWKEYLAQNPMASTENNIKNCLDIMTGFGYGHWDLVENSTSQIKITVNNCPSTNAFLKLVGNTKAPISFYNGGALIGLANLLERGSKSTEGIDIDFVNNMVSVNHFEFVEERSRMTGSEKDTFIVSQT